MLIGKSQSQPAAVLRAERPIERPQGTGAVHYNTLALETWLRGLHDPDPTTARFYVHVRP